jgi:two-component system LytT family response regulator
MSVRAQSEKKAPKAPALDPDLARRLPLRLLLADDNPINQKVGLSVLHKLGYRADLASNGVEVIKALEQKAYDILFLDVQMPELDGFGVLEAIDIEPAPVVVFVTAHDRFALRAFEVHAVDYLLKPFDRERFQTALARALEQVRNREGNALAQRLSSLLADLQGPARPTERIAVKIEGRVLFVNLSDIDWIEASHNYVELHVGRQTHLLRQTIKAIEARLPSTKFVRISRSVIVNTDHIKELQPLFYGDYTVILHNGNQLTLSRRYRDKLPRLGLA